MPTIICGGRLGGRAPGPRDVHRPRARGGRRSRRGRGDQAVRAASALNQAAELLILVPRMDHLPIPVVCPPSAAPGLLLV